MAKQIISIRYKTITPNDGHLINLVQKEGVDFKYSSVPLVAYNKKTVGKVDLSAPILVPYNKMSPFYLYELGIPITLLKIYSANRICKEDLISVKKAFRQLKYVASQCYDRVIADLCSDLILNEIKINDDDNELVFFIEKPMSNKMLGRLGTLHLNLSKVTICFITSRPSDLMTTVMSYHTGKITFDIQRLFSDDSHDFIGPYPGDSEDSLIQTYFYKPPPEKEGGQFLPMRLDIFTQGSLRSMIDDKKELLNELLIPGTNNTEHDRSSLEPRQLVPAGFGDLMEVLKREEMKINNNIYFEDIVYDE